MDNQEMMDSFADHERSAGAAPRTLNGLRFPLRKLFEYFEFAGIAAEQLDVRSAQGYQGWLMEQGRYTAGSVQNFIKAAIRFYQYLKLRSVVTTNPFQEIKKIRVPKRLPRDVLKEKELSELLTRLGNWEEEEKLINRIGRYRAHVLAELLYATGLRVSEAAELAPDEIDFERGVIEVHKGKGEQKRTVFLNEYARKVLKLYVERMRPRLLHENAHDELLFGACGVRLGSVLNRYLKKAGSVAGLKTLTSHSFRHAFGYHFLRAGCDIRYIQDLLGHRRIMSTEVYTRVDKEDLKEVLTHYHPRERIAR